MCASMAATPCSYTQALAAPPTEVGRCTLLLRAHAPRLLDAAYTGLRVDIDRVRQDNDAREDVERKAGLIIWSGRESRTAF
jgi:hypothetical protein